MKHFYKELFAYNHHFNQKLGEFFNENLDKTPEKAIRLFSHILNAQQIWNSRIETRQKIFGVWEIHPVHTCNTIDTLNHEFTLNIIDKYDLNDTIKYTNTKGQSFRNSIKDILFHVINHSTYHRGQIAIEVKQNNIEPLITDYIFYKREK